MSYQRRANGTPPVPGEVKGTWRPDEDEALRHAVARAGDRNWMAVSREVNMALNYAGAGRTAKQCRGRYMHHLKPGLKRGPWTWEEEEVLVGSHARHGNSWSRIARTLPGRTETDIKNHCACSRLRFAVSLLLFRFASLLCAFLLLALLTFYSRILPSPPS
jgi:myb proto-oncogene protein